MTKIPKIIHYCWFGGKGKPPIVKKCLESWKIHLPDYVIIEWNEHNFDITAVPYVKEAYKARKYAFVSDYVRVFVLYHQGGIYLDTDVEAFSNFDAFLGNDSFWGFEQENYIATSTIGAKARNKIIHEFLLSYDDRRFLDESGNYDQLTNVAVVTNMLTKYGLKKNGQYQKIEGMGAFYPQTYFSPYDYINCRKLITDETVAMHHFYKSWLPPRARIKSNIKKLTAKIIGGDNIAKIRRIITNA